jgi:Flp pilus assembly protein TadG
VSAARSKRRQGTIAALVALCLLILLGVAAVTIDGGMLLAERRHAQATADAAALAAADDLLQNYLRSNGIDSGTARASAVTTACANGYTSTNSVVTVNLYPASYQGGPHAGTPVPPGYAEVTVTYHHSRFFSAIWGTGAIPVSARAVARGQWVPAPAGLLLLDPSASGALTATGNGSVTVTNAAIHVNSNSASAIVTAGTNAVITDTNAPIFVTGNPGTMGSGTVSPTPIPSQPPTPDPLRFLPEPCRPPAATVPKPDTNGIIQLQPGYYTSDLKFQASDKVNMAPGIYYIDTAFTINGSPESYLTGSNVMLFLGPNGSLSLAGNGTVTLSPPNYPANDANSIYNGITVFEQRTSSHQIDITGNGKFNITGTVYAPGALVKVSGNGSTDALGSQYITKQLHNVGGGNSGSVTIAYNAGTVGRTRRLNLVE